ncbi:MAG: transcription termination factor Rho [Puniceicoccales bacterium]|jgi:transcription termination factor Rho|nr:transcription termination factor Rho [Puniceicoccales bacterium]
MPTFENTTESGKAVFSFDETSIDQNSVYGSLAEGSAPATGQDPEKVIPPNRKGRSPQPRQTAGGGTNVPISRGRPRKNLPATEEAGTESHVPAPNAVITPREKVYVVPDGDGDLPPDDPFAGPQREITARIAPQSQQRERSQGRTLGASSWNGNNSRFRSSSPSQAMERPNRNIGPRNQMTNNTFQPRREPGSCPQNSGQTGYLRRTPFGNLGSWEKLQTVSTLETAYTDLFSGEDALNFWEISSLQGAQLEALATSLELPWNPCDSCRQMLIDTCLRRALAGRTPIRMEGYLDIFPDGNGCLLLPKNRFQAADWSPFVPRALIRHWGLRSGQFLRVSVTLPRDNAPMACALRVESAMGQDVSEATRWPQFRELTPFYPTTRMMLENDAVPATQNFSMRIVDLVAPIGFGQRGLIVAPPRTGKTVLLQAFANSIMTNHPDVHMMILLIDERPEEVTDFRRMARGEVFASTFDEAADNHVHLAEMVIEHARRRVECGQHVVILLDSITRLARAYNTVMPASGRILTGGIDANALQGPKSFFGSARNIEGGGSLTILGTALVETGSRMDDVIFEEFKGTGNMELHLDKSLADKRVYPAIDVARSGTRKEELLYHPDELSRIHLLRRALIGLGTADAMDMLQQRIRKTRNNVEFLMTLNRN